MWFSLSLLTAVLVSCSDVLRKKATLKADIYVIVFSWSFFALIFFLLLVKVEPFPVIGPHFWPALIASITVNITTYLLYVKALKNGDLSLTMPMLAFTPLLLLITSPIIVGEFPGPLGLVGIFLIVAGSYFLNIKERSKGYIEPFRAMLRHKGSRLMLTVAIIFSIGANVDKVGILNSSPIYWLIFVTGPCTVFFFFLMIKKSPRWLTQINTNIWFLLIMGICDGVAGLAQTYAVKLAMVPYVIAIKRTSVVWTSLGGFILFKEKGMRERMWAIVIMIMGVLLIGLT